MKKTFRMAILAAACAPILACGPAPQTSAVASEPAGGREAAIPAAKPTAAAATDKLTARDGVEPQASPVIIVILPKLSDKSSLEWQIPDGVDAQETSQDEIPNIAGNQYLNVFYCNTNDGSDPNPVPSSNTPTWVHIDHQNAPDIRIVMFNSGATTALDMKHCAAVTNGGSTNCYSYARTAAPDELPSTYFAAYQNIWTDAHSPGGGKDYICRIELQ